MNRLAQETSPYLLQHADNPVDWYPWCEEARHTAREANRPILLSIGYSACHWCHVMAHESFENAETAKLMNELFINIKVDREERPDLDRVYQHAHQLLVRRPGGWPLTMFLTPDGLVPFFGGTYFPDSPRYGMPAFREVLQRVSAYYRKRGAELRDQTEAFRAALTGMEPETGPGAQTLTDEPAARCRDILERQFDAEFGGFGEAPKFPHASSIEFLLHYWWRTAGSADPDTQALFMAALSLRRMAEGGIYDHLGGGFARYSVDRYWSIPHFEKMLYDNGPLLALYCDLWRISGYDAYRQVASETAEWVLRDMRSPEGGFFSSLDADSEGEEGRFYVWTPGEIRAITDGDEYAALAPRYGLDRPANFEEHWHLRVHKSLEDIAAESGEALSTVRARLDSGRAKLLTARAARVWPGRDEKVLTSWNALMIRGLAVAGRALARPDFAEAAGNALHFIRDHMVVEGRLLASYKTGRARFGAYLDDHAFLLDAALEVLRNRWETADLQFATWLAEQLLDRFAAPGGGFYFTAHDHEALLHRSRPMADEAMASGNGVAARALTRLGHLLGEERYLAAAEATLRAAWAQVIDYPHAHPSLLIALEELMRPPQVIILRGEAAALAPWRAAAELLYHPHRLVLAIPAGESPLPGALALRVSEDAPVAYVCTGTSCSLPIHALAEFTAAIRAGDEPA
jgi:uncharacterized protein YyaL (SSP411 family)